MKSTGIRYRRLAAAGASALVLALGAAGCGEREPETSTTVVATPPAETTVVTTTTPATGGGTVATTTRTPPTNDTNAGAGGPTGTETEIADAVNRRIHTNTQMTGSRVTAVVDASGTATLTGFTQNQQQKALAEKAARNTPGVVEVKNKLEIRPTGGTGKTPKTPPATTTKIIVVPDRTPAPRTARPDDSVVIEPDSGTASDTATQTDRGARTSGEETAPLPAEEPSSRDTGR